MAKTFENQTVQDAFDLAIRRAQRDVRKKYQPLLWLMGILFVFAMVFIFIMGSWQSPTPITYSSLDGSVITLEKGNAIINNVVYVKDDIKDNGLDLLYVCSMVLFSMVFVVIFIYYYLNDRKPEQMAWDAVKELPNANQ
jgi:hypothetical protein